MGAAAGGPEAAKANAARGALELVKRYSLVGVGTGSTVEKFVELLAGDDEMRSKLYVASSVDTALKLAEKGLRVLEPSSMTSLEVYVDGADEVDPSGYMIKGGGGAHTLEKVLYHYADTKVIIVDYSKLARRLGERHPIPVDVLPQALGMVVHRLESMGMKCRPRRAPGKYGPLTSDVGAVIVDVVPPAGFSPAELSSLLDSMPGVVSHGLFLERADYYVIGYEEGYAIYRRDEIRRAFERG
ncbi:MAG: ribose-5-phosphate isomerase RpiA [Desulfurococcaceae archaeon]